MLFSFDNFRTCMMTIQIRYRDNFAGITKRLSTDPFSPKCNHRRRRTTRNSNSCFICKYSAVVRPREGQVSRSSHGKQCFLVYISTEIFGTGY